MTEIERYQPREMMSRETDSWSAVLPDVVALAENIAQTEFVPQGLRGSTPKVVAAILHGRELGLPPMTALAHTTVINGRPGTSAEVMRALIQQAGHDLHVVESSARRCVIRGHRAEWPEDRWTEVVWTIEDAAKAGLLEDRRSSTGKVTRSMYRKWPAAMLLARASTTLARMIFADVIHGMRSSEELEDMAVESLSGEVVAAAPTRSVSRARADVSVPPVETVPDAGPAPDPAPAVAAPARKRASRRGSTRVAPAEAKVVETEIVEEPVKVDPAVVAEVIRAVDETAGEAGSVADEKRQRVTRLLMHWNRLLGTDDQPADREERLWWTGVVAGRPVESTNDLTSEEIWRVLSVVERLRSRAQVEALVSGE